MTQRFDTFVLDQNYIMTPEGYLETTAAVGRIGIQKYMRGDGRAVNELRPADEVFKTDSLATLKLKPITDDHPSDNGKRVLLDAANISRHQKGHIGETVVQDGRNIKAKIIVTDINLINKIKAGKRQLSCGYTCDAKEEPGAFEGVRYDTVQRNITYNHLAVVDRGRAGSVASLRLDSEDGIMVEDQDEVPIKTDDNQEAVSPLKIYIVKPRLSKTIKADGSGASDRKNNFPQPPTN